MVEQLASRGLRAPELVVADGHAGLGKACLGKAMELWPQARSAARCTLHEWRNLKEDCPVHAHAELERDYDAILYARDGVAARKAEQAFLKKWKTLCPAVVRSCEEAGGHLLTFTGIETDPGTIPMTSLDLFVCGPLVLMPVCAAK